MDLKVIGRSGLTQHGGYIHEEFLPELRGKRGLKVYREMRDNDSVIGAVLFAIEMLLRQVKWMVQPSDDSEEAIEVAEFVETCFHDMEDSWEDTFSEILSFLPYGFAVFEVVFKLREGYNEDPRFTSKFDDGKIGWRKWALRAQDTIDRWDFDEEGNLLGLWQVAPPDYQPIYLPMNKLLLFRTNVHKGNPEGRSVLRNAYRSWWLRKHLEQIEGIGIERDLAGLPVAYVPPQLLSPNASEEQKAILRAIKDVVVNIRRDEQEGIIFPLMYDANGRPTYDLKLLSTGGQRQFNTDAIIARYDQRIAMTLLADFILLGHEQVGSFALSSDKTDLFAVALGAWLNTTAAVINERAIPTLLRLNAIDLELQPSYVPGDIEKVNLTELADYIAKLSGAGVTLFPNRELEKYLHQVANLPEPSDEELEEREAELESEPEPEPESEPEPEEEPEPESEPEPEEEPEPSAATEPLTFKAATKSKSVGATGAHWITVNGQHILIGGDGKPISGWHGPAGTTFEQAVSEAPKKVTKTSQIIELAASGKSVKEIIAETGFSPTTVYLTVKNKKNEIAALAKEKALASASTTAQPKEAPSSSVAPPKPKAQKTVEDLYKEGKSVSEISKELGVKYQSVYAKVKTLKAKGVQPTGKAETPPAGKAETPPAEHTLPSSVGSFKEGDAAAKDRKFTGYYKQWSQELTLSEQRSVKRYTGPGYASINRYLRTGEYSAYELSVPGHVKRLDSALSKATIPYNVIAYRGTNLSLNFFAPKGSSVPKPGDIFEDKGFVSTSLSRDLSKGWGTGVFFEIRIPKGSKGAYVQSLSPHKHEKELLLPRGAKFKIISIETEGARPKMVVDYIPSELAPTI